MSERPWEVGDVAAILANPFYAIEIHASLGRTHEYFLTEAQWIGSNARALEELGSEKWLRHLLEALKAGHPGERLGDSLAVADPYPAITVHPTLCLGHPPIVEEEDWIRANVIALEDGAGVWLQNLLSVLKGVYVGDR
jgi:hypothetical protein